MAKTHPLRLGDLQHRILRTLWERGEATVAQVHHDLGSTAAFAYTTIATMLRKMEDRELVRHHTEGRSFIYEAAVTEAEVTSGAASHLVERLFEGSLTEAVNHLLSTREVSRAELARLEKLIAEHKKRL